MLESVENYNLDNPYGGSRCMKNEIRAARLDMMRAQHKADNPYPIKAKKDAMIVITTITGRKCLAEPLKKDILDAMKEYWDKGFLFNIWEYIQKNIDLYICYDMATRARIGCSARLRGTDVFTPVASEIYKAPYMARTIAKARGIRTK